MRRSFIIILAGGAGLALAGCGSGTPETPATEAVFDESADVPSDATPPVEATGTIPMVTPTATTSPLPLPTATTTP